MKYLKTFNEGINDLTKSNVIIKKLGEIPSTNFDINTVETEYGSFMRINIRDIHIIDFIWSNKPFFSDYKDENGKYGSLEKRISLSTIVSNILLHHFTRERFKNILSEIGFNVIDINNEFSVNLVGQEVIEFFYLIESYAIKY